MKGVRISIVLAGLASLPVLGDADAVVLCSKRSSGVVAVKNACSRREDAVLLSQFGAVGPQGPPGPTGATGAIGSQGTQGEQGPQGAQGSQGDPGPQGDQGPQGLQGPPGDPGGAPGPQGEQGPAGPPGPQGEVGPQGTQGETGPQASQGDPGPEGVAGLRGPQGDAGPSDAFPASADGPIADLSTALAQASDLFAGSYIVSSKLWLSNSDETNAIGVVCTLAAGEAALDEINVTVGAGANAAVPLTAATVFPDDGGAVAVSCSDGGAGTVNAHHAKIIAVRIGTLH